MKIVFILMQLLLASLAFSQGGSKGSSGGGHGGNGGHGIRYESPSGKSGLKLLDKVEYSKVLIPHDPDDEKVNKVWILIKPKLELLKKLLPETGTYLEDFFIRGSALWWFAGGELKLTNDQGNTNLYLVDDELEQLAVNKESVIQIVDHKWKAMKDDHHRAALLMHEAVWSAIGDGFVGTGQGIRQISSILLNLREGSMPTENLANFLKKAMGEAAKDSDFYKSIDYDMNVGSQEFLFKVKRVVTKRSTDLIVESNKPIKEIDAEKKVMITKLNPHPRYKNIFLDKDQRLVVDIAEIENDKKNQLPSFQLVKDFAKLCTTLDYAGYKDWQLPSGQEIYNLFENELAQTQYIEQKFSMRYLWAFNSRYTQQNINGKWRDVQTEPGFEDYPYKTKFIFSSHYKQLFPIFTQDQKVINAGDGMKDVTDAYNANSHLIYYPQYFCIRKFKGENP